MSRGANRGKPQNDFLSAMADDMSIEKMLSSSNDYDISDPSLESELLALTGGGSAESQEFSKQKPAKNVPIINNNLQEIDFTDPIDDQLEVDENDPDLMAELSQVLNSPSTVREDHTTSSSASGDLAVIDSRIQQFSSALNSSTNEDQRRRYERQLKTLHEARQRASRGQPVDVDSLPAAPVLPTRAARPVEPPPQPPQAAAAAASTTTPQQQQQALHILQQRQAEYKSAAVEAHRAGRLSAAKEYLMIYRSFDQALEIVRDGREPIDLSDMPPPPNQYVLQGLAEEEEDSEEDSTAVPPAPSAAGKPRSQPGSLQDCLQARLDLFNQQFRKADDQGDASKARRLSRIVQQYRQALQACQKGAPFEYGELAPCPGLPDLPLPAASAAVGARAVGASAAGPSAGTPVGKQVALLQLKQQKFRALALEAKQRGDMDAAKEFLRNSKGFEPLIRAAAAGLAVDLSRVPELPRETNKIGSGGGAGGNARQSTAGGNSGDQVECAPPVDLQNLGEPQQAYSRLLAFTALELSRLDEALLALRRVDAAAARRLDLLRQQVVRDTRQLEQLRSGQRPVPGHHFEWRQLTWPNVNPDLAEDVLELTVVAGHDLPAGEGGGGDAPDTYVQAELTFPPTDGQPQTFTSEVVRRSAQPAYNATFQFRVVNRRSRQMQRFVATKTARLEVWCRRGLLRKDVLLAGAQVPLAGLERECTVEVRADLCVGKRAVGGQLVVRLRLKESLQGAALRHSREKFLCLDGGPAVQEEAASSPTNTTQLAPAAANQSIDVLLYEKRLIQERIGQLESELTGFMIEALQRSMGDIDVRVGQLRAGLGDRAGVARYLASIEPLAGEYATQAKLAAQQGQRDKANVLLSKQRLVVEEVRRLRTGGAAPASQSSSPASASLQPQRQRDVFSVDVLMFEIGEARQQLAATRSPTAGAQLRAQVGQLEATIGQVKAGLNTNADFRRYLDDLKSVAERFQRQAARARAAGRGDLEASCVHKQKLAMDEMLRIQAEMSR